MPSYHSPHQAETLDRLFDTILQLKDRAECYAFFEDLCTIKELHALASRLEVAAYLARGMNYQEVEEKTGVSSATISRVKRCLEYGSGGYRRAVRRQEEET